MQKVVYRNNHKFHINDQFIKPKFRRIDIINGLYAEIYAEFFGAKDNPKYATLTPIEKIDKVNEFATTWLKQKGYYNG